MTTETIEAQERVTAAAYPCPECRTPMVGARVWDAAEQVAVVGAVCRVCESSYRIVWAEQ